MNKTLAVFHQLVASNQVNPNDYYSIRFNKGEVVLQGKINSKVLKSTTKIGGEVEVSSEGYVHRIVDIEEVSVRVTLT